MRTFDLSPLFRQTVGFDRLVHLLDSATRVDDQAVSYPPYNIEKTGEDTYRVTMAVAGFNQDDLTIVVQANSLVVTGKPKREETQTQFLHHGIAGRAFERRFELADTVRVGGASLRLGLLHIDLVREVPEALKPRQVAINSVADNSAPRIEGQKAA